MRVRHIAVVVVLLLFVSLWSLTGGQGQGMAGKHSSVVVPGRISSFSCAPDAAAFQLARVRNKLPDVANNVWYWGCTQPIWLELLHEFSPSTDKVMLDVGMNKGYSAAGWYALWNPSLGLNPKTLKKSISSIPPNSDQDCGACADCTEVLKPRTTPDESEGVIKVIGYDGSKIAVEKHQAILRQDFPNLLEDWVSINNAVSETVGTANFPDETDTSELASLGSVSDKYYTVKTTNGPDIFAEHGLDEVFMFKIDTEGYDGPIVRSLYPLLEQHRITVLMFEYHKLGKWGEGETLFDIQATLDALDYECYLTAHECVVSLSNTCWNDAYEFNNWSNIMCLSWRKARKLISTFDDLSFGKNNKCEVKG